MPEQNYFDPYNFFPFFVGPFLNKLFPFFFRSRYFLGVEKNKQIIIFFF